MKFETIPVTSYMQNCTLIWCDETLVAALIDPGGDVDRLLDIVVSKGLKLEKILLTHGHLDHAGGAAEIRRRTGARIIGPNIQDKFWLDQLEQQSQMLQLPGGEKTEPDSWQEHGDSIQIGHVSLEVLFTPGHTPGHICFYHEASRSVWVGDVLFNGSIGRTDFPRGSLEQLVNSCRQVLFLLGDDVTFYPGHGPSSTLGHERQTNPFVGDSALNSL